LRAKEVDIKDLIQACLANNPQAQFELYSRYSKAMYSIAVRMLGNTPEAEDALQDAFVNAFKNLKKFDNRVSFGAWLRRILINVCLNKLRQNSRTGTPGRNANKSERIACGSGKASFWL